MRLLTDEAYAQIMAALVASRGMHYTVVIPNEKAIATLLALPTAEPLKVTSKLGILFGGRSTSVRKGDFVYAKKEQS